MASVGRPPKGGPKSIPNTVSGPGTPQEEKNTVSCEHEVSPHQIPNTVSGPKGA